MRSMTAYGYAVERSDGYVLEVELKSVNNRYLEFNTNINSNLAMYENHILSRIKEVAKRGKVDVTVRLRVLEGNGSVHVDEGLLGQYLKAFEEVGSKHGLLLSLDAQSLLALPDVLTVSSSIDGGLYGEALDRCLDQALASFDEAKSREGEATKADLMRLGRSLEEANNRIGALVGSYEGYFRDRLVERYKELDLDGRFDETKLMQEVGALLVKYSINEEQQRLKTHLAEYFRCLESSEPVGKKLDFLCQEMNRETNTTASKSQSVEITMLTVGMKDNIEDIREQIRNIE